jgi:SAM-dependent methyltransferase
MRLSAGDKPCRACGARRSRIFHEVERVPLHCCQLIESREAALEAPTGQLRLSFCEACGFIQNDAFDPALIDYSVSYEDSQAFSPRFQEYSLALVDRLIQTYGLRGRDVLEIGCGKGDFLAQLCETGNMRGVGIDPSYLPGRQEIEATGQVEFIRRLYSSEDRDRRFDFLCCRHTLEHLPEVREVITMVGEGMLESPDSVAFFEVPDVTRVVEDLAFWDLYYEHCSYFSPGSLARLFRSCGFEVLRVAREYEDQYLLLDASRGDPSAGKHFAEEDDLERMTAAVDRFSREMPLFLEGWRDRLARLNEEGKKAVLWGAGSKAVGFFSTLDVGQAIEYVVDINPHKHDMHHASSGHQIVSPAFLKDYRPDLVIVMNSIYQDEIRRDLAVMGLEPEVIAL